VSGDLRLAWRMIVRMPLLAGVVVGSLGIGIGVNTTIFSWIQALTLSPLPGVRASGDYQLIEARSESGSHPGLSWREYQDLRARLPSLREPLASRMTPLNLGESGRTERVYSLLISGNYFSALGLSPALGRFISSEEVSRPGGEPVVVISYDFWQTRLAGRRDVLGRRLHLNDQDIAIVGVAPRGFQGTHIGLSFDVWVPATLAPVLLNGSGELDDRGARGYQVMARLAPRASLRAAQAELDAAMAQLARDYPATNATLRGEILGISDAPRGPLRFLVRALTLLQGVMLLLLLAVCGNTANLVLARASSRQREIGVRLALGGGPWRVASLLLTENLVLGVLGAVVGAAIAVWGTQALRAVPLITAFPVRFQTGIDLVSLSFAMLLGILCGLLFGIGPALQLARLDPQRVLRAGATATPRTGLRNALMGAEVALATVVLVAAALFLRSFRDTRETDPGFRREGVLLAAYDLSGTRIDSAQTRIFTASLLQRLQALPGVQAAAIAAAVPLDIHGLPSRSFTLEGRARADATDDAALSNTVTPGYFRTMDIPLRAGRDFAALDDARAAPEAIVNEAFVRRYLGAAQPLGRRLESGGRSYVITGVVATSLSDAFGELPTPVIYFSYRDRLVPRGELHVRTRPGAEQALAPEVQRAVRELDPTLPVYDVRTLGEHVEKNLFFRRIPARMFIVLGPLLLLLAAIGIYAVVAYTVAQRTREIGVRLALGATSRRVVTQIVGESLGMIGFGTLAGWLVAYLIGRQVAPGMRFDLSVYLGVPVLLLGVALLSCWLPARRATRVDALVALRQE
jgi:putative ABC transport system permease protein